MSDKLDYGGESTAQQTFVAMGAIGLLLALVFATTNLGSVVQNSARSLGPAIDADRSGVGMACDCASVRSCRHCFDVPLWSGKHASLASRTTVDDHVASGWVPKIRHV